MYEFIMLNQWKYRKGGCREKVWCGDSLTPNIVQKIYDFKRERWIKVGVVASSIICNSRQQTHGLRVSPSKLIPDLSPKKIETGKKHYYHFLVIKYFCLIRLINHFYFWFGSIISFGKILSCLKVLVLTHTI